MYVYNIHSYHIRFSCTRKRIPHVFRKWKNGTSNLCHYFLLVNMFLTSYFHMLVTIHSLPFVILTGRKVTVAEGYNNKEHNWKQKAQILQVRKLTNTHAFPAYHRIDRISIVSPKLLLKSQDTYRKILHSNVLRIDIVELW